MKFTIEAMEFAKAIYYAFPAIPTKPMIEAMGFFLVRANAGVLSVAATDLEKQIEVTTKYTESVEGEAGFLVDARAIRSLVKSFGRDVLECTYSDSTEMLEVKSPTGKYQFRTLPADNFAGYTDAIPSNPICTTETGILIRSAIDSVAYCGEKTGTRSPALTGAHMVFDATEKRMTIAATDAHRIARRIVGLSGIRMTKSVIVPIEALNAFSGTIRESDEVAISSAEQHVIFENITRGVKMYSKTIGGKFPEYGAFFDVNDDIRDDAIVEVKDVLGAAQRMGRYADEEYPAAVITSGENSIELQSVHGDGRGTETIPAEVFSANGISFRVRIEYLIETMKSFASENVDFVNISSVGATKPVLFIPLKHDGLRAIIMPLREVK